MVVPTSDATAAEPVLGPDPGETMSSGFQDFHGEVEPKLKSRLDPASIVVNWDVEGLVCEEDQGPEAVFGRPKKDVYLRAHSEWSFGVYLIDCRSSIGLNAEYVLSHQVAKALLREDQPVSAAQIYLMAIHAPKSPKGGGWLYWPIKLGDPAEIRTPAGHVTSALAAIQAGRVGWHKIYWRNGVGKSGWRALPARQELPDPVWPEDPMGLFLETISDRYIDSIDDPVIKAYCGEV